MTVPTSTAPQPRLIALLPWLLSREPNGDDSDCQQGTDRPQNSVREQNAMPPAQPVTPRTHSQPSASVAPESPASRQVELPQWHRRSVKPRAQIAAGRFAVPSGAANSTGPNRQTRPPQRRIHLAQRVSASSAPSWSREGDIGVQRTSSRGLTPAGDAASLLVQALLEVLSRRRTREQLVAHCAPDVYHGLPYARHCDPDSPAQLLTIWVCEPVDGIAEVSAAFRCGNRVRALALQLTSLDYRWRITELQIG